MERPPQPWERGGLMLLALDTSTLTLSLALVAPDGRVVEHFVEGPPRKASEQLPSAIEALLQRHQLKWSDVTGFVVGLGPGSFTGLRIGAASVKGLAYALERPVAGVSSLAALALEGPDGAELWALAVVKKGELYLGRYRREGQGVTLLAPESSLTVAALAEQLKASPHVWAVGPALDDYSRALVELGVPEAQLLVAPRVPSAVALASLAKVPAEYRKQDVFALEPHYIRGSGAEENPKFPPLPGPAPTARLKED